MTATTLTGAWRAMFGKVQMLTARWASSVLLGWFLLLDVVLIGPGLIGPYPLGGDAIIYMRAAAAYMDGRSPWDAYLQYGNGIAHFAGLPPTVVAFAPFALLPENVVAVLWVAVSIGASLVALRALGLPVWWLAFPPLVDAVWSGNPQVVVLALLVASTRLAWVAPVLKIYAIVPILAERRWRVVLATCGAFVVSMAILWPAWVDYFAQFGTVSARLVTESGGGFSAFRNPPELVVTVLALLLLASVDLRAAGWLAIPAAWPATQFHYAILALPVISWPLGFALAFPSFITVPPTVVVYAIYRFTRARLVSRARLRSDTHVRTQERQVAHRS